MLWGRVGFLFPLLFNLHTESIFASSLRDTHDDIKINGEADNNIRYVDDTVLLAYWQNNYWRITIWFID